MSYFVILGFYSDLQLIIWVKTSYKTTKFVTFRAQVGATTKQRESSVLGYCVAFFGLLCKVKDDAPNCNFLLVMTKTRTYLCKNIVLIFKS